MANELDLIPAAGVPVVDSWINKLYGSMLEAAEAGDIPALGLGMEQIDLLVDRLRFVRSEAGKRTYERLPDEKYRYRGETRTRKAAWMSDDKAMLIEPKLVGGGWKGFDYIAILKSVADKAYGLSSKVISPEGEVVGTIEDVVATLASCVSFSNVKADYEKGTGLAKWGIERDEVGRRDPSTHDVRVQTTRKDKP